MRQSTVAGLVLIPVAAWVALSPFIVGSWDGDFHFGRFLLAVLPGCAAATGGLIMLTGRRLPTLLGGAITMAAGVWLMVGPAGYALLVSNELGTGPNGESIRMLQWVGFFFGAGAFISLLSSYALGLMRPLEFSEQQWAEIAEPGMPASQPESARARVPMPEQHPRRQRGGTEVVSPGARRKARRDS
jgi:hypothetical protein